MCQWSKEGHSLANCSLPEGGEARQVGCPIANTTFLNPLLKCRYNNIQLDILTICLTHLVFLAVLVYHSTALG